MALRVFQQRSNSALRQDVVFGLGLPLFVSPVGYPIPCRFSPSRPFVAQRRSLTSTSSVNATGATSWFQGLTPYVEHLPTWFGLTPGAPYAYAISIVAATVLVRSAVTLPIAIWQRRRTRRMVDIVGPRWTEIKRQVPLELARKCRIQGKSHAEYKTMVNEELQRQIKHLIKQNRCAPFATIAVPLAVNIPLFVFISLVLRSALVCSGSPIGAETVPWWSPPSDLMAKFESSAKILQARGIEGEALRKLTIMEGPTLAEVDKTMFSPIGLGMLTLINVELGQWLRKPLFDAGDVKAPMEEKQMSVQQKETKNKRESLANFRSTVIGNTLRTASIAFVVIASQAPTGLALYWLTSAVYTLAQNSAFAFLDSRRRSYAC